MVDLKPKLFHFTEAIEWKKMYNNVVEDRKRIDRRVTRVLACAYTLGSIGLISIFG